MAGLVNYYKTDQRIFEEKNLLSGGKYTQWQTGSQAKDATTGDQALKRKWGRVTPYIKSNTVYVRLKMLLYRVDRSEAQHAASGEFW